VNLAEISKPYIEAKQPGDVLILAPKNSKDLVGLGPSFENAAIPSVNDFLKLPDPDIQTTCSALIIHNLFGQTDLRTCNDVLTKAVSALKPGGVLIMDVMPVENLSVRALADELENPESVLQNRFLSRHALTSAIKDSFKLLHFHQFRSKNLPDILVFGKISEKRSPRNAAQELSAKSSTNWSLRSLFTKRQSKAVERLESPLQAEDLANVFFNKYIPVNPRIVLICPPAGLETSLQRYLNPKSVRIFGGRELTSETSPFPVADVQHDDEWEKVFKEANNSAEFIFFGAVPDPIISTQYFNILKELARIRNKSGFVLFRQQALKTSLNEKPPLLPANWPEKTVEWAKNRFSTVRQQEVVVCGQNYICINELSPFSMAVKRDKADGKPVDASIKFEKYVKSKTLSEGDASLIVREFAGTDLFAKTLLIFASEFGVLSTLRRGLLDLSLAGQTLPEIVHSLEAVTASSLYEKTVRFDLIGEFYRLNNYMDQARLYWQKGLANAKIDDVQEYGSETLSRKLALSRPCEIDRKTGKRKTSNLGDTAYDLKDLTILAESRVDPGPLSSLINEHNTTTVIAPGFDVDVHEFPNTHFGSLIGLVPENSDLSKETHRNAQDVSLQITEALTLNADGNFKDWLKRFKDVVALTIEDFLARNLLILEAYAKAANDNPKSDILLLSAGLGYFDTSLGLLLSRISHDKIWLQTDQPKSDLRIYDSIFDNTDHHDQEPLRETQTKPTLWFDIATRHFSTDLDNYFSAINAAPDNARLVLGNLSHRYNGKSAIALAGSLCERGEKVTVIDSATTPNSAEKLSSLLKDCFISDETAKIFDILPMVRHRSHDQSLINSLVYFTDWIRKTTESVPLVYRGANASKPFSHLTAKILARHIPILLFNSLFAEKLLNLRQPQSLVAVSTREPHNRIFAQIARQNGIPVTMVQSVDILRHPRYKKPIADQIAAIDETASDTFVNYLGVPKNRIEITGSPRSALNFHPEIIQQTQALIDGRGLELNPPKRVLFATRTEDFDKNLRILRCIAQQAANVPGLQIIVKTHPREEDLRLNAYAQILREYKIGGHQNVFNQGVAETLIILSDVVISFPSNVVRAALEQHKPTLVYVPDGEGDTTLGEIGLDHLVYADSEPALKASAHKLFMANGEDSGKLSRKVYGQETIDKIVDLILQQGKKRSSKKNNKEIEAISGDIFGGLSLRETYELIKHRAEESGDKHARLGLFYRALALSNTPEEKAKILRLLASHGSPSFAAAEFFAQLCKSANGHPIFGDELGKLSSVKLSFYAEQLKQSRRPFDSFTILALAQSCLSSGHVEAATHFYKLGIRRNSPTPHGTKMDNEFRALTVSKWDGETESEQNDLQDHSHILVVAERGTDPNIFLPLLPKTSRIEVYFDGKAGATLGARKDLKSRSSRDVLDDQSADLRAIIDDANNIARVIAGEALQIIHGSAHSEWLNDIRNAIEMELRAGLITQLRRHSAMKKAVTGSYDAIIMACNTASFLARFSDVISAQGKPVYIVGASQSPARRAAFGAARKQGIGRTLDKQKAQLKTLRKSNFFKDLEIFDSRLNKIEPRICERKEKRATIAVTSWRITTINDGCLSLLGNFQSDLPVFLFDTSRSDVDVKRFLTNISEFSKNSEADIRPFSGQYNNISDPELPKLRQSNLAKSIFAAFKKTNTGKSLAHPIQLGIWNQIGILLYKTIPMLYDLHVQISTICLQSDEASLFLMPGRNPESLTAQNSVSKFGLKTVDVQTAYFSRTHIYTAPNGDVVTALDEWSKDLFVEWFKVPEEKIRVVGTSRFDRFSKLRLSQNKKPLNANSRQHICLATQPIQSGHTIKMLAALNELHENGVDFDCTVKLHPRQSEEIINEIEEIAHSLFAAGRLTVTQNSDLAQILLTSNLVVTAFSNVAVEAALMDRPVIIANFTDTDGPIPFMDFGIAEEARSKDDLITMSKRILFDQEHRNILRKKRKKYFDQYPSQWLGEAGKNTLALIIENMRKPTPNSD